MKVTRFYAWDAQGKTPYRWGFWRDPRTPATWMLEDHEGYIRTLETTWVDSLPRIRAILANYGLKADIS